MLSAIVQEALFCAAISRCATLTVGLIVDDTTSTIQFKVTTSLAPSHSYPDGLASPMVRHFLSVCIGFYRSESVGIAVIKLSRNAVLALLEECHMKQDALHKTPQK